MANDKKTVSIERPSDIADKKKKQWMLLFIGIVAVAVFIAVSGQSVEVKKKVTPEAVTTVEFSSATETDWIAEAQIELQAAKQETADARAEAQKLKASFARQDNAILKLTEMLEEQGRAARQAEKEQQRVIQQAEQLIREAERKQEAAFNAKESDRGRYRQGGAVPPPLLPGQERPVKDDPAGDDYQKPPRIAREVSQKGVPTQNYSGGQPLTISGVKAPKVKVNSKISPYQEEIISETSYEENEFAGFMPAGSFVEASLMHGMEAGASEYTRTNPQPVIMRLSGNAFTPGDAQYQLKGCFAIGNAFGDLSTERAHVRISRLSCLDSKQGFVLEAPVDGFLVDSDGTQGLRGKIIRRNGQILAKGLLAGIAEGIASVAGTAAQTGAESLTAPTTGALTTITKDIDAGELAKAGAFGGASNAASIISEYYLEEAKQIFPAIFIPTGRKVTVVFQQGVSLKWQTYKDAFRKEVTPQS